MILKAEHRIYFVDKSYNAFDFGSDLRRRHEDMSVVLREASYSHQSVKLTRFFVSVHQTEFADTQRQIFITMRFEFINEHTAGTVHRLDSAIFAVDFGGIHVFFVMIPMPRSFPKTTVKNYRSGNFDVTLSAVNLTPVIYKSVTERHSVGKEKRETFALVKKSEEFEFFAEFGMVALFGFFKHSKVSVHIRFFYKRRSVDTGKHFILLVSAPIRARKSGEFESLYKPRARKMRSSA